MSTRLAIFVIVFFAAVVPVQASFCAFDAAPAASLLFPFVAIDYNDSMSGITTIVSFTNLSSEAHVTRVTIWTDYGLPVLTFNVLLTGYDVHTIDVRKILKTGQLRVTAKSYHTTYEGAIADGPVSPRSELNGEWVDDVFPQPQPTIHLDRCDPHAEGYPGNHVVPIPESTVSLIRELMTKSQVVVRKYSDDCEPPFSEETDPPYFLDPWFPSRTADNPTWMYITVDVVDTCDNIAPTDPSYWPSTSEDQVVRFENVLTGDVYWRSSAGAAAGKAVHLEADPEFRSVVSKTPAGDPVSFYHRYSTLQDTQADAREPLPTAWALRFSRLSNPLNPPRLRVWKGSTMLARPPDLGMNPDGDAPQEFYASNCNAYTYYAWDEEENVTYGNPPWGLIDSPNLLPLATQEVAIDQFNIPLDSGWLLFVWPASNYGQEGAPEPPDLFQTWMGIAEDPWGTHATFIEGTPVANANCYPEQVLPALGVNYDYVDRYGYRGRTGSVMGPAAID